VSEAVAQNTVVQWLRLYGILHCHVPNGGKRRRVEAAILKGMGVVAGMPDLLIFDSPPGDAEKKGVALEMKAPDGGRVSPAQKRMLSQLQERGWVSMVAYGAADAFRQLKALGYGIHRGNA